MCLLIFAPTLAFAQPGRVLTQNDQANTAAQAAIIIKWYAPGILHPEGVNLYRRSAGQRDWTLLNPAPITQKQDIHPAALAADPDMAFYTDLIREAGGATIPEPMLLLNVVVKSFQSNAYADFLGLYFRDTTTVPGETYTYRVQQLTGGQETLLGQSAPLTAGPFTPGAPVRDFTVSQEEAWFLFDWAIEEDQFYAVNIYQTASDSAGEKRVNKNPVMITEKEDSSGGFSYPSPKLRLTGFREHVTYTFRLAGLDFFGNETAPTRPLQVAFDDVTPPLPPTALHARQDTMLVHLRWQPAPDPGIREYRVYRSSLSEGPYEAVFTTTTDSQYTDSIRMAGPYYYYVSSYDHSGNEARSRTVFADIPDQAPPAPPAGLTLRADTGVFELRWHPGPEPDLLGYLVYRSVDTPTGDNIVLLTADPLTEPRFTQKLPQNIKNECFFFVVALDSSENRSQPCPPVSARLPDVTPPEQPVIRDLTLTGDEIILSWSPNVDSDLRGYHVLRADSTLPVTYTQANVRLLSRQVTRYTDRSAQKNQGYLYHVLAIDSAGNSSPPSAPLYARLPAEDEPPGALELSLRHRKRRNQNLLTWTAPEGDWLGYVVYRGETPRALRPQTGLLQAPRFTYTDSDLQAHTLSYQVRAYDKNGNLIKSEIKSWEK